MGFFLFFQLDLFYRIAQKDKFIYINVFVEVFNVEKCILLTLISKILRRTETQFTRIFV